MLNAVSLYSGVGGLDFGFEAAGFRTSVALEIDQTACRTMRLNRDWVVIEEDINSVNSESILRTAGLGVGEVDILIGGPPCQPFSKSGYWVNGDTLRLDDPRADTLVAYLRVLRDLQPKSFLIENVSGIAFKKKDEGLKFILGGIDEINRVTGSNYTVTWRAINSADFGVPQLRERVFFVGSKDGQPFEFPKPTHVSLSSGIDLIDSECEPYRTAWDAFGDLPEPDDLTGLKVGGKWAELLPTIPEGQNYLWHTNRGGGASLFGWRTRYWSFLLKLSKRLPSWTIQAQPGSSIGPFHWNNRRLSAQEMCRLQTFPDGIVFDCGRTEVQRMIGNAVPSLMAEVLAREIRRQYFGEKAIQAPSLMPPRRRDVPPPVSTTELPEKYVHLIGDHADHPGTRKHRPRENSAAKGSNLPLLKQML